ncbi:MAG: alpha-ketoglutarate-dependent dioxygenase AlkB [Actinomycetota bacterium]|nr:alpha-ketoglutarate-dependent dioxygenase AlkB [Actinomycetota bacterium]
MSQQELPLLAIGRTIHPRAVEVAPGAVWVPSWLDPEGAAELLAACREWAKPPAGLRRPRMPDGSPFSTMAVCLGWHWYPYTYSRTCDDHDGAPVKPFDPLLARLGARACADAGFDATPFDAAIVNYYSPDAKLGLHRDGAEGAAVIERGSPVVTISLGDTCTFRLGNSTTRTRPFHDVQLASGDLFVFGGPARGAYHGVPRTHPGTAPAQLGLVGRISVTLRESGHVDPSFA